MSKRFKISSFATFLAFALVIATGASADDWEKIERPGERMFDQTFQMDSGARLRVEVQDADVEVMQGDGAARVEVYVKGRSTDKADEYFEDSHFRAGIKDGTLLVETRFPRHRGWHWGDGYSNVNMKIIVTVPKGTATRLKTDDGDVRVKSLDADLRARTSDGDIRVGDIRAKMISLKTSDGDVVADLLVATEVELQTSDGDVRANRIEAETAVLSTSDGDVSVNHVKGQLVSMSTSDGDIRLEAEAEKVTARTSDGDITVAVIGNTALNLRTHDGNVRIEASSKLAADLDLRGESVNVRGEVNIKGEVGRNRVRGSLHGGGATIVARTSDGSISLDLR